jgi:hypothetical protein
VTGIATYSADMDNRISEMQPNVDGINAASAWMNTTAQQVENKAAEAAQSTTDAQTAETNSANSAAASLLSANNSASSAVQAANSAATASAEFTATSSTSLLIAVSSKTFAIETGKEFVIGQIVKASSSADPANEMSGEITAASSGSITVLVTQIGGSGTFSDWSISINSVTLNDLSTNTTEGWSGSKISTELSLKASLNNANLTGNPTAPAQSTNDDSTKIANTAYVKQEIGNIPASGALVEISTINAVNASTIDFVNVFTSTYDYYIVFGRLTNRTNICRVQFHSDTAGTRLTTSTYNTNIIENVSINQYSNENGIRIAKGSAATRNYYFDAQFFLPTDTSAQSFLTLKGSETGQSQAPLLDVAGVNSSISQIYGFSFVPDSGVIDGSVTIFGVIA